MKTCIGCAHWNLKTSTLRAHGFGQCKAETNEAMRAGRTFAGTNVCRIDKFKPADVAVVARREKEQAVIL